MRHLLLGILVFFGLLTGDARPGWCPFSEPSPGAGIRLPQNISPPPIAGVAPAPQRYPAFDRPREVEPGDRPHSEDGGAPMVTASGQPNAWEAPPAPPRPWMGNPLWTTSACIFILIVGVLPLLWMQRAAASRELPPELQPRGWRGWTARQPAAAAGEDGARSGAPQDDGGSRSERSE